MSYTQDLRRAVSLLCVVVLCTAARAFAQNAQEGPAQSKSSQSKKSAKEFKQERDQKAAAFLQELETSAPLVVVNESNPWTGADGPTLAVYPDGRIIYWQPGKHGGTFRIAQLSDAELGEFIAHVDTDALLPLSHSPFQYQLKAALDAAEFSISVRQKGRDWRGASRFGSLRGASRGTGKGLTPGLKAVIDFLAAYENPNSTEWVPEMIQLVLLTAQKSEGPDLAWPIEMPALDSAQYDKEYGEYTLLITREQFAQLKPLLEAMKPAQRFRVGDKLFQVFAYYPFPHMLPLLKYVAAVKK